MKKSTAKTDSKPVRSTPRINDYGHDRTVHSLGRRENIRAQRRRKTRKALMLVGVAVLAGLLVWILWPMIPGTVPGATTGQTTGTPVTSGTSTPASAASAETVPTTGSTTATAAPTLSPDERQARLDEAGLAVTGLLESSNGRYAVFFQNMASGETWLYNAEAPFVAASSIKLGINTLLYSKIASGDIGFEDVLTYDSRSYPTGDYEAGTGTIQGQPDGTAFTVRDTTGLSIRISDNCATNMIIRLLGGIDTVNTYLSGISDVVDYRTPVSYVNYGGTSQSGRHRTSATDLGLHAVNLYKLWQKSPSDYQPLIDDLCSTEFDFGIQKGIPPGVQVAHKIGTNGTYSAENDVGIVFADEPFVLCVMTEMGSAQAAHQIQAEVAQIFFEYVDGLN